MLTWIDSKSLQKKYYPWNKWVQHAGSSKAIHVIPCNEIFKRYLFSWLPWIWLFIFHNFNSFQQEFFNHITHTFKNKIPHWNSAQLNYRYMYFPSRQLNHESMAILPNTIFLLRGEGSTKFLFGHSVHETMVEKSVYS